MTTSTRINLAIAAVTTLVGAASGFIRGFAPPEDGGKVVTLGMVILSSAFALLLIQGLAETGKVKNKTPWFAAGILLFVVSVVLFFTYARSVDEWTISCPPDSDRVITGDLTKTAKDNLQFYNNDVCSEIGSSGGMSEFK